MKKLIFIAFMLLSVCVLAQDRNGDYDVSIHARDLLEVDADTMVSNDTTIHLMDLAYLEWSSDGVTFNKTYTLNDTWMRYSGYNKTSWDTIRFALNLWEVSGDSVILVDDRIVYNDSIFANFIKSELYFLGDDTLSHENLYNGGNAVSGYVLTYSGDTAIWLPSSTGNRNTARNVGVDGYGVFQDSLLSELQFRNVASADTFIGVTMSDSTIYFTFDGEGRKVIAGIGLSEGGNLGADITINLYIPELTELTSVDADDDWVAIFDQSASTHKKVNPLYFFPDLYVNNILSKQNAFFFNVKEGDNVSVLGDGTGAVQISAVHPELHVDSVLVKSDFDTLNIVGGTNVQVNYLGGGGVSISADGGGLGCNTATQTLSGTTDTLDVFDGTNGYLDISGNTTIRIEPTASCNTGNITVLCDVNGYTIEFVSDYTMEVSPFVFATTKVITTTATAGAKDMYSYFFDGTNIFINGTKDYE